MSIPVLGIPTLNRHDLLLRCIASIDYVVERLVIVDNSQVLLDDTIRRILPEPVKNFTLISHPNAGVAGSWNEIIKLFPAPWWMLVNDDIKFTPGDLQKMAEAAGATPEAGCLYANHGASFWIVTKRGVATVGTFDENFKAYLEDCDFSRRCDLLGVTRMNVQDVHAIHGDDKRTGSCTVNLNPKIAHENMRTHGMGFGYYEAKWGGKNERETFKTPFNDPNWPIWAWKFDPDIRAKQQWSI